LWYGADSFENTGNITATSTVGNAEGDSSWAYAEAYGVYADDYIGSFSNSGSITATATAGSAVGSGSGVYASTLGVYLWYGADSFENTGNITATSTVGNAEGDSSWAYAEAYGVYADGAVYSFTNSGKIMVNASVGSANGEYSSVWAYGISGVEIWGDVNNFVNTGNIGVYVKVGGAAGYGSIVTTYDPWWNAGVYGVYIGNNVNVINFTNSGKIVASVEGGNATGENSTIWAGHVLGVDIGSDGNYGQVVDSFVNNGTIETIAKAGDSKGTGSEIDVFTGNPIWIDYSIVNNFLNTGNILAYGSAGSALGDNSGIYMYDFGIGFLGPMGNFINRGNILTQVSAGNAVGKNSEIWSGYFYGIYFGDEVANFKNSGIIGASANAGNAVGNDSSVNIEDVSGVVFDGDVQNFVNEGLIYAQAQIGDAIGANATTNIDGVAGVYFDGNVDSAINNGSISIYVKGGTGAEIKNIAGLVVDQATKANITNNGSIYIKIDAPDTKSISDVAGIYVFDSSGVTISNPGAIYLWNNAKNADIRTLWVSNSQVTLQDKFAIVFGQPGIEKRPIYVDSTSILNLNNTDLIARVGSILKFRNPYYVIENDGTVDGNFKNLLKGYQNQDIVVSWYGANRGEDSAVIFNYQPRKSISALGIYNSINVGGNLMDQIVTSRELEGVIFAKGKVFLAQAKTSETTTDVGPSLGILSSGLGGNAIFFHPFYINVDANDLGYDSSTGGFVFGYERKFTDNLRGGLFAGYARSNVDYKIIGSDDEHQNIYTVGSYFDRLPSHNSPFYLGLSAMGYFTDHNYSGQTGGNYEFSEKASYWSRGVEGRITAGYSIFGKDWEIMPNLGVGLTYWNLSSFRTKALDPNWSRHYDSEDNTYAKLMAGVTGVKRWVRGDKKIYLAGLLRLEEAIGNNDISINQELPALNSGKIRVKQDISNFSFVGKAELGVKIKDRYNLSLSPGMVINSDYKLYTGQLLLNILF
jgi:hypothetical protein